MGTRTFVKPRQLTMRGTRTQAPVWPGRAFECCAWIAYALLMLTAAPARAIPDYAYATVGLRGTPSVAGVNTAGGGIRITESNRPAGQTTLAFPGWGQPEFLGNIQVAAAHYAENIFLEPHYCKLLGTRRVSAAGESGTLLADVGCFRGDGSPARSEPFVIMLLSRGEATVDSNVSYFFANQPSASEYEPRDAFVFPGPGSVRVRRLSRGSYSVLVPRMREHNVGNGNVQITPVGPDANYCKVLQWNRGADSRDLEVRALCFQPSGDPVDARFSGLVVHPGGLSQGLDYAFLFSAERQGSRRAFSTHYRFVSVSSASFTSTLGPALGRGRMIGGVEISPFPGVVRPDATLRNGIALVTAYGPHPDFCQWEGGLVPHDGPSPQLLKLVVNPRCASLGGRGAADGPTTGQISVLAVGARRERPPLIPRTATLRVIALTATSEDECGEMEFMARLRLSSRGAGSSIGSSAVVVGDDLVDFSGIPGMATSLNLVAADRSFTGRVTILDIDREGCGGEDDIVDVNPLPGEATIDFRYDLTTRLLTFAGGGFIPHAQETSTTLRAFPAAGSEGDETARIQFTISVDPPL